MQMLSVLHLWKKLSSFLMKELTEKTGFFTCFEIIRAFRITVKSVLCNMLLTLSSLFVAAVKHKIFFGFLSFLSTLLCFHWMD